MPYQNRVTPFGDIERSSARGLLMGNRGILHRDDGSLGSARWRHKNWIACTLSFNNRKQTINAPGRYTQLFFLDEATALAAGHRPCAECRRKDFVCFARAWQQAYGEPLPPRAGEIDDALHRARVTRGRHQMCADARLADLPEGTFISFPDEPSAAWLIWSGALHRWAHSGYGEHREVPQNVHVSVLTPVPIVRVLAAGFRPFVHPFAAG